MKGTSPFSVVVTTIQSPTASMRRWADVLRRGGERLIVVGDQRGPHSFPLPGATVLTWAAQQQLSGRLARLLPANHYARKNLGYLLAMRDRPACLFETDDDNTPLPRWRPRALTVAVQPVRRQEWVNVYRHFSRALIWPRGLPLTHIKTTPALLGRPRMVAAPVQQELANGDADVDAIWRLVFDTSVQFRQATSIALPPGTACPFNSQATWWWPVAWPLLYLPSHCSFRLTDIWRSFVAQRCLWELGHGVVFHAPTLVQERNPHDLARDFRQELPGYEHNTAIMAALRSLRLAPGPRHVCDNLLACYRQLVAAGFLPRAELPLVRAWLADLPA